MQLNTTKVTLDHAMNELQARKHTYQKVLVKLMPVPVF